MTDEGGRVRFTLPARATVGSNDAGAGRSAPASATPPAAATSAAPGSLRAALRADDEHAVAIDLRFPYDATDAAAHTGSSRAEPPP